MSNIVQDWIIDYLRESQAETNEELQEVAQQSQQRNLPIIEPEVGNLLNLLVKISGADRILELGAAVGYSTLWLAQDFDGEIVTIELKEKEAIAARDNFAQFGYDNIELKEGDALEIMPELEAEFDLIFIDAAKGQYLNYLDESLRLVKDGGLIVADDVLFKGMIADDRFYHPRYSTLTKRLKEYVERVMNSSRLDSTIIPLGDGVAISRKKGEQ
ncbi:class I SAM-dependent methyltransferase [Halanaerobacter jeridensis]|uniref:tRNA 5-hydroxyuridine methyltransferase n=1 Tax=Halanaerobacter jeridensis TaxID=706427 RepID=A0A938XTK6_9FIRM|nr:putative O-methyltransferase YrrM [Halanaerobacter jeridensis]